MKHLTILLFILAASFQGFSQNKDQILGKWVNSTSEANIEITKRSDKYFGKIVWLKEPKDEKGNTKTDVKNPVASLRSRTIVGLEILKDFTYDDGEWTGGKIYDPKSGKTYSCNISVKKNGDLSMRGYIGVSLIGRTEIWKRVK